MKHYEQAWQDLNKNDIPQRLPDGEYSWNHGLLNIMSDSQFERLKLIDSKIQQLEENKNELKLKILSCKEPTDKLNEKSETDLKELQNELDEAEFKLEQKEKEKEQLLLDVYKRGGSLETVSKNDSTNHNKKRKKTVWSRFKNWCKKVGKFLVIWGILELLMTAIQWSSLRDVRTIEEIATRSIAIAVILFFFHFVSNLYEKYKHPAYKAYLIFNILVVLTMIVVPPYLYHIYPETTQVNTTQAWDINVNTTTVAVESNTPSFVLFYLDNEWIPAALSVFYFLWIYFVFKPKKKEEVVDSSNVQNTENGKDDKFQPTKNRLRYLNHQVARLKKEKNGLTHQIDEIENNPIAFKNIRKKLENLDREYRATEEQISNLENEFNSLFSKLQKELDEYEVEFKDVLNNDSIRQDVVKPDWPSEDDILEYFQINKKPNSL